MFNVSLTTSLNVPSATVFVGVHYYISYFSEFKLCLRMSRKDRRQIINFSLCQYGADYNSSRTRFKHCRYWD